MKNLSRIIARLWCGLLILVTFVVLSACANHHDVVTKDSPYLYPYQNQSFRLLMSYSVMIDGEFYRVPSEFITDLASVPRPLWSLFPPHDAIVVAPSVLHDYFYSGEIEVTRKFADDVFYHHLVNNGMARHRAWLFWSGVRLFGKKAFKDYQWSDSGCS